MTPLRISSCFVLLGWCALQAAAPDLRNALVFHASFDQGADADIARGDRKVYTSADRTVKDRDAAKPGLQPGDLVRLAPGEGKFGGAIEFKGKMKPQVFYRGPENIGFKAKNWDGSISFWMRVDPDRDLAPGYCDPLQLVGQAWSEGKMFVEFSKDHTPRHFRFVVMGLDKFWNPNARKYEEMSDAERPMVAVHKPPFRRDHWTHVVITFANVNSGEKNGRGTLYLDGKKQGTFDGWNHTFNWDATKSGLTLGYAYVGFIDDLAVFNREFKDADAQAVFKLKNGIRDLHGR